MTNHRVCVLTRYLMCYETKKQSLITRRSKDFKQTMSDQRP